MKKTIFKSTLLSAILLPVVAVAGENISIGTQVGIFGIGANAKYKIDDQFGVRAGFDMFSIKDYEVTEDEVKYNFDVDLQDIMLIADWHPWNGSFRTSGGVIVNNSSMDGDIVPNIQGNTIDFTFNGTDYSYQTDELGSISTLAEFDPVAPYVGIGWDTSFDKDSGFGFTFDFGLAFQGSIKTSYKLNYGDALDIDKEIERQTADIPDSPAKTAQIEQIKADINNRKSVIENELKAEIDKEMKTLQDTLDKYQIMPYISIGFNYKF